MAISPILKTNRLEISPFGQTHLTEKYIAWLSHPEVVRFSEQRYRKHSYDSCLRYWESFQNSPNYFWAVVSHIPEEGHIGTLTAYIDAHNQTADIGILIGDPSVWNKGYGAEAWLAVCQYLFQEVAIRKITAGTLSVNKGMLKLMEKTGMEPDGTRKKQVMFADQEVDIVHAALFCESCSLVTATPLYQKLESLDL